MLALGECARCHTLFAFAGLCSLSAATPRQRHVVGSVGMGVRLSRGPAIIMIPVFLYLYDPMFSVFFCFLCLYQLYQLLHILECIHIFVRILSPLCTHRCSSPLSSSRPATQNGLPPDSLLLSSRFPSSPSHQRSLQIRAHGEGLGHGLRQRLGNEQRAGVQLIRGQ